MILIFDGDPNCSQGFESISEIRSLVRDMYNYDGTMTHVVGLVGVSVVNADLIAADGGTG